MEQKNIGKSVILQSFLEEFKEHKFFGIIIIKAVNIASDKLKNKVIEIIKLLNTTQINLYNFRALTFEGYPDDIASLRSLGWKLLLSYLPSNVEKWEEALDQRRSEYTEARQRVFRQLELDRIKKSNTEQVKNNRTEIEVLDGFQSKFTPGSSENKPKKVMKKNAIDHPLAVAEHSKWKSYFDDLDLLEEIDKDVRRTRTHMHFFFMPAKTNVHAVTNEQITQLADKKRNEPGVQDRLLGSKSFETNADIMCRILFMYAKKFPEVRYIQGMNEMLAPILYCFSSDQNPYFYLNLEADCYNCFENLMGEVQDIFIRNRDTAEKGIQSRIKELNQLLKLIDKELYEHFKHQNVELQYFAFRWYTLFLTQEFEMPDILRLWDSIFSEVDKFEFLNMICLAIIQSKRNEILKSDFAGVMLALQNLDKLDIEKLIKSADAIRNELNKNIY